VEDSWYAVAPPVLAAKSEVDRQ